VWTISTYGECPSEFADYHSYYHKQEGDPL
jgi:hypothetical protein